jgi:hypothetical protein
MEGNYPVEASTIAIGQNIEHLERVCGSKQ